MMQRCHMAMLGCVCLLGMVLPSLAETVPVAPVAAVPIVTGAVQTVAIETTNGVPTSAPKRDPMAARFLNTCSGCHSLNGVKLTGPDLNHVAAWPEAQLKAAIKRMEVKVGPLPDADIASLAQFLQSIDVRDRLAAEGLRIQAQFAAKLEVGSSSRGRAFFFGNTPLANDGLSCVSCHQVQGQGGRLGPDLTGIYKKMGEMPLLSSLDKVGFKIMAAHYQRHPITRQEAIHVVAYLKSLDPTIPVPVSRNFGPLMGVGVAVLGCAGLMAYGRKGSASRSRKLEYRKH